MRSSGAAAGRGTLRLWAAARRSAPHVGSVGLPHPSAPRHAHQPLVVATHPVRSAAAGVPGCVFVHASGFIGGNDTLEGAVAMASKALDME